MKKDLLKLLDLSSEEILEILRFLHFSQLLFLKRLFSFAAPS